VAWYWVPEYVLGCLIVGYLASCMVLLLPQHLRSGRAWRVGGNVATVCVVAVGTIYVFIDASRCRPNNMLLISAGLWAREHLPADRLFARYDAGYFRFFSQRDTVALNGLVSDVQTMRDSRERRFNRIVDRFGVDYLVVSLTDAQISAIPRGGLLWQADYRSRGYPVDNKWLCIVDRHIYTPFED
jgi:hypothetical protein